MAGHEPTAGLVGNGILALLRQPDQLARLQAEPDLIRNAVSELLRFDGPNQFVRRITTQPTMVGDVEVPAGAVLFPGLASANRDPRRWGPTAEQVVVDRADADQHLQFGGGMHACLGAHLARLQAELFLRAILARLDGPGAGRRAGVEHPHVHPRPQLAAGPVLGAGMSTASDWKARPEGPDYASTRRRLVDAAGAHRARSGRGRAAPGLRQ